MNAFADKEFQKRWYVKKIPWHVQEMFDPYVPNLLDLGDWEPFAYAKENLVVKCFASPGSIKEETEGDKSFRPEG